jgi:hypothetical protein
VPRSFKVVACRMIITFARGSAEACVITFPMFRPFLILRRHTNLPAPDF